MALYTQSKAWLDVFHGKLQEGSRPWKAAFGGTALYTNDSSGEKTMSVLLSGCVSNRWYRDFFL